MTQYWMLQVILPHALVILVIIKINYSMLHATVNLITYLNSPDRKDKLLYMLHATCNLIANLNSAYLKDKLLYAIYYTTGNLATYLNSLVVSYAYLCK